VCRPPGYAQFSGEPSPRGHKEQNYACRVAKKLNQIKDNCRVQRLFLVQCKNNACLICALQYIPVMPAVELRKIQAGQLSKFTGTIPTRSNGRRESK